MARLSGVETKIAYPNDKSRDLAAMSAHGWQSIYKEFKIGLAVNDGRFLTQIDDREEKQ